MKLIVFLLIHALLLLGLVNLNKRKYNYKFSNNSIAFIAMFLFYISIVALAFTLGIIYKNELDSFDFNHDGSFSNDEMSPEQQAAMHKVISDTGRNMAPIIGIFYSIIYFVIIRVSLWLFNTRKTN